MKITTDMIGSETASVRQTRLKSVYDWYKGDGAYVAAGNLGVVRAAFNDYLTSDIANKETFASWVVKFNILNSPDTMIRAQLFGSGAKGVWFDPNDLPTLTQNSDGTVPVTAAGQPVGTMIDKSDKESAVAGVRPNLLLFPNDFSNAVWTKQAGVTTTGGQLAPDGSSTAQRVAFGVADRTLSQDLVVPAGNYTTALSIKGVAGETIRIRPGMNPESVMTLTGDWQTIVVGAKGVISSFNLNTYGGVTARTIYVWSPKFESGLYATQAVASKRPIYGVIPKGGRRNLLVQTHDLALWGRDGTPNPTANGSLGGESAFVLTDNSTSAHFFISRAITTAGQAAGTYTLTARLKKDTSATSAAGIRLGVFDGVTTLFAGGIVNPVTGAVVAPTWWTYGGRATTVVDSGDYWHVKIVFALSSGHVVNAVQIFPAHFSLDGSDPSLINVGSNTWAAPQLVFGAESPYQRVVSDYDITESGVPSLQYLASDLIDDELPAAVPSLGSNATVWFAVDGASTILTGQTVAAGTIATLRGARTYAMGAVDRPLSAGETAALTTYLNKARGAL